MGKIVLVYYHGHTRRLRRYLKHRIHDLTVELSVQVGCYYVKTIADLRENLPIKARYHAALLEFW